MSLTSLKRQKEPNEEGPHTYFLVTPTGKKVLSGALALNELK